MLQRGIGVFIGGLVTILLLMLIDRGPWDDYVAAVAIGALVAFFWPIVIAWWFVRRAKDRREDQVAAEVQRQLDQQKRPPG